MENNKAGTVLAFQFWGPMGAAHSDGGTSHKNVLFVYQLSIG